MGQGIRDEARSSAALLGPPFSPRNEPVPFNPVVRRDRPLLVKLLTQMSATAPPHVGHFAGFSFFGCQFQRASGRVVIGMGGLRAAAFGLPPPVKHKLPAKENIQ